MAKVTALMEHKIHLPCGTYLHAYVFSRSKGPLILWPAAPVALVVDKYNSASFLGSTSRGLGENTLSAQIELLTASGYTVALVDLRGSGRSADSVNGVFDPCEREDLTAIVQHIAHQPWCDGRVAMFGSSYRGVMQFFAAAQAPDGLQSISAEMSFIDLYEAIFPGGIFRDAAAQSWSQAARASRMAQTDDSRATPNFHNWMHLFRYRDSKVVASGERLFLERSPYAYIDEINRSGTPVQMITGWLDPWVQDNFDMFYALNVPRRLIIGPWSHSQADSSIVADRTLDWLRLWKEPESSGANVTFNSEITYFTLNQTEALSWSRTSCWPPKETQFERLFFDREEADTQPHLSCYGLRDCPSLDVSEVTICPSPAATTGIKTRWSDIHGSGVDYEDFSSRTKHHVRFATDIIPVDMILSGSPVVNLIVRTHENDLDFFCYLARISSDAGANWQYLTEGCLRLSQASLTPAPSYRPNRPYHPFSMGELTVNDGGWQNLTMELGPTSVRLCAGDRLLLSIASVDIGNAESTLNSSSETFDIRIGSVGSSVDFPFVRMT